MLWLMKVGAAAAGIAGFFYNGDKIIQSGDLDAGVTLLVMALLIGYILGARVGNIIYWIMAIYLVLKLAW